MERKALHIELKDDRPGDLTAEFSRLNVIDLDGDVTLPGAFEDGAAVRLLPAHNWAHYMIGRGVIRADRKAARFEGHLNLNTTAGRDWYESIKDGQDLQEFSYGFDVLDSTPGEFEGREVRFLKRLKVHEVSPVTLGAGIGTHVVSIKSRPDGFDELLAYFAANPDEALKLLAGKQAPDDPDADPSADDDDDTGERFADQAEHVLADVQALTERAAAVAALRAKAGRTFSAANITRLTGIADEVQGAASRLRDLLDSTATPPETSELDTILGRYVGARDALYRDMWHANLHLRASEQ